MGEKVKVVVEQFIVVESRMMEGEVGEERERWRRQEERKDDGTKTAIITFTLSPTRETLAAK